MTTKELLNSTDAAAWAAEFMRLHRHSIITERLMLGWFANAIMAGHDHARRDKSWLENELEASRLQGYEEAEEIAKSAMSHAYDKGRESARETFRAAIAHTIEMMNQSTPPTPQVPPKGGNAIS